MSRPGLDEIGWNWQGHRTALWWLGMLYRRPTAFETELKPLPRKRQILIASRLYLDSLPYILLIATAGRALAFGWLDVELAPDFQGTFYDHIIALLGGIVVGIVFGIVVGIVGGIVFGIVFGIVVGIVGGIVVGIGVGIGEESGVGIAVGLLLATSFYFSFFRPYYHLFHPIFVWPVARGAWYPRHPVAWDDLCPLPFPFLDRLLLAYADLEPEDAKKEIERLIDSYPSQRKAALRAKTALIARQAAQLSDLSKLDEALSGLPEGKKGFLSQTNRLRELASQISAKQARLNTISRAFLKEPIAESLLTQIENFQHRVSGFDEPLASEFRKAAQQWQVLARSQLEETRQAASRQPVHQVFRAGDPVDRQGEAFVPRQALLENLDSQIMLSGGCPGLLVFGRRRMGKSTLVRNLAGFVPESVRSTVISMLEPAPTASLAKWAECLAQAVRQTLELKSEDALPNDLSGFFRFLKECDERLKAQGQRLLLILDEYETIDRKIGEGVFSQDLLAALRESMQSHRRITWVFVGRDRLELLPHAPWTSYLVSVRTLEVPLFSPEETRLLLTEPLKYSPLWSDKDPGRPSFEPGFWGSEGIDRIHQQAGGWPHLVQLIAETVVDEVNQSGSKQSSPELLERAFDKAASQGHAVLYELMERESQLPGEWEYLCGFIRHDAQSPPDDLELVRSLRRRLLVSEENGQWRLRVPLMMRWLRRQ